MSAGRHLIPQRRNSRKRPEAHPPDHIPVWQSGAWGVLVGVAKCTVCGRVSSSADFRNRYHSPTQPTENQEEPA